jgi:uncharacterized BrkB/YihY/UPF0761 family membrane protein
VIITSFFIALYVVITLLFGALVRIAAARLGSTGINFKWFYKASLAWPIVLPIVVIFTAYYILKKDKKEKE